MGVSKVVYGSNTLIDLTADTITAADLMQGKTAHGADGEAITGTYVPSTPTETVLWMNPNPTSSFSAQVVSLSDSLKNYKYFKVLYHSANTSDIDFYVLFPVLGSDGEFMFYVGNSQAKGCISYNIANGTARQRRLYINNTAGTEVGFTACQNVTSTTTVNGALIPIAIYGIN